MTHDLSMKISRKHQDSASDIIAKSIATSPLFPGAHNDLVGTHLRILAVPKSACSIAATCWMLRDVLLEAGGIERSGTGGCSDCCFFLCLESEVSGDIWCLHRVIFCSGHLHGGKLSRSSLPRCRIAMGWAECSCRWGHGALWGDPSGCWDLASSGDRSQSIWKPPPLHPETHRFYHCLSGYPFFIFFAILFWPSKPITSYWILCFVI